MPAGNPSDHRPGNLLRGDEPRRGFRLVDGRRLAVPAPPAALRGATDPRWVLAVRVAESLHGEILRPVKREQINRLGRVLGLSPFDISLIVAIIQDQARRGVPAADCPGSGQSQLELIPLRPPAAASPWRRAALWLLALAAVEAAVISLTFLRG